MGVLLLAFSQPKIASWTGGLHAIEGSERSGALRRLINRLGWGLLVLGFGAQILGEVFG